MGQACAAPLGADWYGRYHPRRALAAQTWGMTSELATALKGWRARAQPRDVGYPEGERRTPGLRREELAQLAGISVDYLVRLEQGRATTPSPQVVGSLARALRLSRPERDVLFRAAGIAPPSPGTAPRRSQGRAGTRSRGAPQVEVGDTRELPGRGQRQQLATGVQPAASDHLMQQIGGQPRDHPRQMRHAARCTTWR